MLTVLCQFGRKSIPHHRIYHLYISFLTYSPAATERRHLTEKLRLFRCQSALSALKPFLLDNFISTGTSISTTMIEKSFCVIQSVNLIGMDRDKAETTRNRQVVQRFNGYGQVRDRSTSRHSRLYHILGLTVLRKTSCRRHTLSADCRQYTIIAPIKAHRRTQQSKNAATLLASRWRARFGI